jgi:hypothetical protein
LSHPDGRITGTRNITGACTVDVCVENHYRYVNELRTRPDLSGSLLASEDVTGDVAELVEEAATNGVLNESLSAEAIQLRATVRPICRDNPIVEKLEIELSTNGNSVSPATFSFSSGRWDRTAQRNLLQLREEGTVAKDQTVYQLLLALPHEEQIPINMPAFQPPTITTASLEECGVCSLASGQFTPDRPLLISSRLEQEAIQRCVEAGWQETGAAVVGRCVRLPKPLSGTTTSIVTILSALMFDPRHTGNSVKFDFHPAALVEAQRFCNLRGLGESVVTVFHTHGWGCGDCNQKAECGLAEASPSLQDYQLLETLFPGKNTLMPIAGRKFGADGRNPVLQVYAWRSGKMRPIRWSTYND